MMKTAMAILALMVACHLAFADGPQEATDWTQRANQAVLDELPFMNQQDFEDAQRGFIATLAEPVIQGDAGQPVWDLAQYAFLNEGDDAPPTVNPSLWRNSRLNMLHGLFEVVEGIYQVRGFDLSVISFIESDSGVIVIDPLVSAETAGAALDLYREHRGDRPVVAVIYTHSHVDHYGGVRGVVSQEDVDAGRVMIIAPEGFLEHAVSENVMAGNAMSRRASHMYGSLLPRGPQGQVDGGLGKGTSTGIVTLIPPTDIISETGQEMTVDGVRIVFQNTPGTEAPAEMNFHFPQFRALCMAENCTHTLHNLYTLRGAQVRDAKAWSEYLDEATTLFGEETDVVFASHHWPRWGQESVLELLENQRDMYRYIHDQTLRLANHGYTMVEIAEMVELPETLAHSWYNRGYYGSLNHNVKAVYQRYLGWFDGNAANLNPHPPAEASLRYVEYMGGAEAILQRAEEDFDRGDYRWVAQVVNHIVFADPGNQRACNLQANALEQLGYQAESGPWRNFYLTAGQELRQGVQRLPTPNTASPDTIRSMPLDMFFDFMGVRLNGPRADGHTITLNLVFPDTGDRYLLELSNSVLHHWAGRQADNPDATITLARATLNDIALGATALDAAIESGEVNVEGDRDKFREFLSLLDEFDLWFNIVTP